MNLGGELLEFWILGIEFGDFGGEFGGILWIWGWGRGGGI